MDRQVIFRQWMNEHADVLYRYALRCLSDEALCKDMLQETFLAAWRNMDRYKGEASVKNWLFVILKSKLTDHFRKQHSKATMEAIYLEHNDHSFFDEEDHWRKGMYPKQWSVNFTNTAETKEFYKVFHGCSRKLKELQNTVFVMKYVDGLESEEICRELSLSSSNYWVLIHRAKVQLRACLEKNWIQK
jgi:RNA polymerase sigma-70 factor (TIGR02943 family)